MIKVLLETINSFTDAKQKIVKLTDLNVFLDKMFDDLDGTVLPLFEHAVTTLPKGIKVEFAPLLSLIDSTNNFKFKDVKDGYSEIYSILNSISHSRRDLKNVIDKNVHNGIVINNITAKQSAILTIVDHYHKLTNMSIAILDYDMTEDEKREEYSKFHDNAMRQDAMVFGRLLKFYYENQSSIIKNAGKIADVIIENGKYSDTLVDMVNNNGKVINLPILSAFTYNPIYHSKIYFTNIELKELERLKDLKSIVELKIIRLKEKQENIHNPAIEKQIEYYEKKLKQTEYKIREIVEN